MSDSTWQIRLGKDAGSSLPAETETCTVEVDFWKAEYIFIIFCSIILAYDCRVSVNGECDMFPSYCCKEYYLDG